MEAGEFKAILISAIAHAIVFGGVAIWSLAGTPKPEFSSNSDVVLILGDDPDKDAGLVDRERGSARGTADGEIKDPRELEKVDEELADNSALEEIIRQNEAEAEAAKNQPVPEPEVNPEPANPDPIPEKPVPAPNPAPAQKPVPAEKPKPVPAKPVPAKPAAKSDQPKKINISKHRQEIQKNNKNSARGNAQNAAPTPRVPVKIQVGNVGGNDARGNANSGGKSGTVFGNPNGTGENGGDGGRRIADARALYCQQVDARFTEFFDRMYPTANLELQGDITVDVRFSVDSSGNIKFLEIVGSSNPSVRAFVQRVFGNAFASRFKQPPNGQGFTGTLKSVRFRMAK